LLSYDKLSKENMRLIRLAYNYPSYLRQFYAQHPDLKKQTYDMQYQTLMADCFGRADFLTHALSKLGYEGWEPVINAEPMQKVWAHETGVSYKPETWLIDIMIQQVKLFQPDILVISNNASYTVDFVHHLRSECSSIRLIIGLCGAPYLHDSAVKACDLVLSNIPSLVADFRKNGQRCEYMPHAFEPRVLDKVNRASEQTVGFSFIGSIVKGTGFHNQRERLLKKLVQETELQIWADVIQPSLRELWLLRVRQKLYKAVQAGKSIPGGKGLLHRIPKVKYYANMDHPPDLSHYVDEAIAIRSKPAVFGLAMYKILYESFMTLNTHIDVSDQFASNMRLYEATGVGTCLLTDWKPNLRELFEPDIEVVTYRDSEEAVEKVRYLLANEKERRKIAKAGRHRTLRSHTYDIRAQELDSLIRKNVK
jgi:spore maturation protein CgeB